MVKLRYALIYKYLKINYIHEYLPIYNNDNIDVWKYQYINLSKIKHNPCDLNVRLIDKYKNKQYISYLKTEICWR